MGWTTVLDNMMCIETETIDDALIYLNEKLDNKFYYGEFSEFGNKRFEIVEYDSIEKCRVKYWMAWKDTEINGATVIKFRISDRVY